MKKKSKELINKFTYRAEWSEEDGVYIAHCLELPSVKAHAETPEGAISAVKIPISLVLESMEQDKEPVPQPISTFKYKGALTLRTTPEKHKEIAMRAAESGVSINQFILSKIS